MSKPNRHQKPHKAVPVPMTPEEQAAALKAKEEAAAAAKAERERVELFGKSIKGMSHQQLQRTLDRTVRREHVKEGHKRLPVAGLTIAWATVLSAVLRNTRTAEKSLRPDQVNPKGRLHTYPL